ncbi:MAG TPA: CsgG/HfaB family protein [Myxococcales bacterium]|nr:CsgG/HfaB family protein [Myxococcales bacterium]
MHRLRALTALLLSACATVSQRPVPVEAPASRASQVAAQSAVQQPPAHRYKTKIAIARFTNESNYGRSLLTDQDLDRIGKQAGDMLMSRLVLSGKFLVLERPDAAKLEREQKLSGGSMVGADTVIAGSVTEFGRSVGGKSGFLSSTKVQLARAKVDIRLVDVKTGLAYFSANGSGEASTESGEIAGFGSRAEYDATLNDRAIAAAISDVVDGLVQKLSDRPWRTDILEIRGNQIFIAGGERQGLRRGDTLAVLQSTGTAKSRQSGFEITLPPRQVASVQVVSLFGDSETNEGSVCEVTWGAVDPAAVATLYVAEPPGGAR